MCGCGCVQEFPEILSRSECEREMEADQYKVPVSADPGGPGVVNCSPVRKEFQNVGQTHHISSHVVTSLGQLQPCAGVPGPGSSPDN